MVNFRSSSAGLIMRLIIIICVVVSFLIICLVINNNKLHDDKRTIIIKHDHDTTINPHDDDANATTRMKTRMISITDGGVRRIDKDDDKDELTVQKEDSTTNNDTFQLSTHFDVTNTTQRPTNENKPVTTLHHTTTSSQSESTEPTTNNNPGISWQETIEAGNYETETTTDYTNNPPSIETTHETEEFPWSPLLEGWEPPKWITDYMDWHKEILSTHPAFTATSENADFTNEAVVLPPLLIVYCFRNCGGLHDRLGSLPFDLYLANQTKRLLMYVWDRDSPMALETFLSPTWLDWTLGGLSHDILGDLRSAPALFDIYKAGESAFEEIFWKERLPNAIEFALNHSIPLLTVSFPAHSGEYFFEDILKELGETDMIHTTPTFGWIWNALFKPSLGLQSYLETMQNAMNLTKGQYTAIHCRLHYPLMLDQHAKGVPLQSLYGAGSIDRSGMVLEGAGKEFAVNVALHAIQCAQTLTLNDDEPLYFFSDANNLAEYLSHYNHTGTHNRTGEYEIDRHVDDILSKVRVVTRPDIHRRNHHLDYSQSRNGHHFFSVFADLYFAMEARCIIFGYGGFGRFAQQLTNNSCFLQHQLHIHTPYFGHSLNMHENICTNETYAGIV